MMTLRHFLKRLSHSLSGAAGSLSETYRIPPKVIMEIVDAPSGIIRHPSPCKKKNLLLKRMILPPISELARWEDKLAGLRIDAQSNCRSRECWYTIEGINDAKSDGPVDRIQGIPRGARVHYFTWSNDGENLCFTVQTNENGELSMMHVWVANTMSLKARPLLPPNMFLNATFFTNFAWTSRSTLLIPTIPSLRGPRPNNLLVPSCPIIRSNRQNQVVQVRTYQGLLNNEYDEILFEYYATSQLVVVSLNGNVKSVGPLALYTSLVPCSSHNYVLIYSIHRPFSAAVTHKMFPQKVEIWNTDGDFIKDVCDLPLAEDIPCALDSVRKGMRQIQWLDVSTPMLLWAVAQDGGDAKIKADTRDIVYVQTVDSLGTQAPKVLTELEFRFKAITIKDKKLSVLQQWKKTHYWTAISKSSDAQVESSIAFPFSVSEMIKFKREDGKDLEANLYLPPFYNQVQDGPLPCLIWPYPMSKKHAGKIIRISPNSPQIWLARGFAVLTSLSMPVIDGKDGDGYNRKWYIEKLVKTMEAAVKEIIGRGVAHPRKIAICGHSFGGFMSSVLLVHAPHLFCCGVARSGAYNRTLTPFGYQEEYRTLWEATSSYLDMSTILSADKLKKPILLIHGQEDENAGTWPMQSIRFFESLRGHGAECRLVILPLEGHGYIARESVLHVLWEMDSWFQKYCTIDSKKDLDII